VSPLQPFQESQAPEDVRIPGPGESFLLLLQPAELRTIPLHPPEDRGSHRVGGNTLIVDTTFESPIRSNQRPEGLAQVEIDYAPGR
jgi:hypothetical protein